MGRQVGAVNRPGLCIVARVPAETLRRARGDGPSRPQLSSLLGIKKPFADKFKFSLSNKGQMQEKDLKYQRILFYLRGKRWFDGWRFIFS